MTEFLYDGLNPVQETSGATILASILPGLGIDEFLTRTDVVAGVTSHFLTDTLGSPVAVTDNAGAVQTEYSYEPFGKTTFSGTSNSSSYQYTGRKNDGTGLYYYRARYYHPQLQRFVAEDPIEFSGGDVNMFAYVANSPITFRDPTGLIPGLDEPLGFHPPWNQRDDPFDPPPPPKKPKSEPKPPKPICPGCRTDKGKVYDNNGNEVKADPDPQRIWGDGAKVIINLIKNLGGAGTEPEH